MYEHYNYFKYYRCVKSVIFVFSDQIEDGRVRIEYQFFFKYHLNVLLQNFLNRTLARY